MYHGTLDIRRRVRARARIGDRAPFLGIARRATEYRGRIGNEICTMTALRQEFSLGFVSQFAGKCIAFRFQCYLLQVFREFICPQICHKCRSTLLQVYSNKSGFQSLNDITLRIKLIYRNHKFAQNVNSEFS